MNFWLMKTEPDVFSIDDLKNAKNQKTPWEGVRNYQARNFMMKEMKIGDKVLIYHSNATPPGVAGVGVVSSSAYADPSAFDPKSEYFDVKSTKENPRWFMVDIGFLSKLNFVPLETLKQEKRLQNMLILRKGNRLSITPIAKDEFELICQLG
jgi:predicted RNA-binding protein with PUA-like domain